MQTNYSEMALNLAQTVMLVAAGTVVAYLLSVFLLAGKGACCRSIPGTGPLKLADRLVLADKLKWLLFPAFALFALIGIVFATSPKSWVPQSWESALFWLTSIAGAVFVGFALIAIRNKHHITESVVHSKPTGDGFRAFVKPKGPNRVDLHVEFVKVGLCGKHIDESKRSFRNVEPFYSTIETALLILKQEPDLHEIEIGSPHLHSKARLARLEKWAKANFPGWNVTSDQAYKLDLLTRVLIPVTGQSESLARFPSFRSAFLIHRLLKLKGLKCWSQFNRVVIRRPE